MFEPTNGTTAARQRHPDPYSIQFYEIELLPTADGSLFVGIGATICEQEGELSHMEIGHHRVASLDDALEVIRQAVTPAH